MTVPRLNMNKRHGSLNQQEEKKLFFMNHLLHLMMKVLKRLLHWQVHLDVHVLKMENISMEQMKQIGVSSTTRYEVEENLFDTINLETATNFFLDTMFFH